MRLVIPSSFQPLIDVSHPRVHVWQQLEEGCRRIVVLDVVHMTVMYHHQTMTTTMLGKWCHGRREMI
jgi:hypothetical protein